MSVRIFLVEDHPRIREAYQLLLDHAPGFSVCATADTAHAAVARIPALAPDLVLLDLSLPDASGLWVLSQLIPAHPEIRFLVVSGMREELYAMEAFAAGAHGYYFKDDGPDELLKAIETVRQGEVYWSLL